eukprot:g42819.t1
MQIFIVKDGSTLSISIAAVWSFFTSYVLYKRPIRIYPSPCGAVSSDSAPSSSTLPGDVDLQHGETPVGCNTGTAVSNFPFRPHPGYSTLPGVNCSIPEGVSTFDRHYKQGSLT